MDMYQNEENQVKKSPYADSPYVCAWAEPQTQNQTPLPEPDPEPAPKQRREIHPLIAVVFLVASCLITALCVSAIWQGKLDRMEWAMDEKFDALEQLYSEKQSQNLSPLPQEGPLTPGQVYAKNVHAVVSLETMYETADGYGISGGSGFLISDDGYVVTNYHVISGATRIAVTTYAEQTLEPEVIGYDANNDIALLKIPGDDYPYVTIGSSGSLSVGDQVCAIGNPLGELTATLTVGYISGKDRIVGGDGTSINMLQTDAAINPGNSGGPLFNAKGEVVGIITAKYASTEASSVIESLGFAIPVDDVKGILSDLKKYGYVTGAYLGVYVRDVDPIAQSYGLPAGAFVDEIEAGSCAAKAGMKAGDIIINLGGYDIDCVNVLSRTLRRFEAGETITVTVSRGGEKVYLTITLDEKPAPAK